MAQPLTPGWYPDPNGGPNKLYWDGQAWNAAAPTAPNAPPPSAQPRRPPLGGRGLLTLLLALVALVWLMQQCSKPSSNKSSTAATSSGSSSPSTSKTPDAWKYMAGDGTHQMGGADGKNWGVWVADGTTGVKPGKNCTWSLRSVASDRPGEILNEGETPSGQTVTVDIEPDGDVSTFDGTIGDDNHRLVFMTNNCGAWRPQ
jgi:hypothetical protein